MKPEYSGAQAPLYYSSMLQLLNHDTTAVMSGSMQQCWMQEAPPASDIAGARPNTATIVDVHNGLPDRRMPRWFEIICFTNNSNPHAFLFLSDQLGHILEKEEEFSWGQKNAVYDDMILHT